MTIATIAPASANYSQDPDYFRGRADAYDDSRTRTVDQMVVLAGMAIDYASIPYALGYFDRVTELRMETDAVSAAEAELAQTSLARKQGRDTSRLHTAHRKARRS
ncbi:hypothetical protein [Streptomyces chartreusis]|uniref:hypothetical protein n=1 Tax=Streptomyces chartreusis TaxID=1969 RepID=UPI003668E88D